MSTTKCLGAAIGRLRRAAFLPDRTEIADSELLTEYVRCRDETAFEVLLRRHGAMVLGVCRRVLGNEADAEDAFQATFLVLVRKAASVVPRALVGNWLYGVALNTARKARAMGEKRRTKERHAGAARKPDLPGRDSDPWLAILDEELGRLPEKYRAAIVCCDLEGKKIKEAARHLHWPQGSVAGRLARARVLL